MLYKPGFVEKDAYIVTKFGHFDSVRKIDIDGNKINYIIKKELGIELVGDIRVKIEANEEEEPWDEIIEEPKEETNPESQIENEVNENFIQEQDMI